MEETVTSVFNSLYYLRLIGGSGVLLLLTGSGVSVLFNSGYQHPAGLYILDACLCIAAGLYYRFFSRSWKRVTVTPEGIVVKNVISGKQISISYPDITAINTYRSQGRSSRGQYSADFVIAYGNDKWISLGEDWYENYGKLTMAIYLHKYGPGHGRERYLARHGQG